MNETEYNAEALLPFDAIQHIRNRWRMFFHVDGIVNSPALMNRLAQDPKLLGAEAVAVFRFNEWFVIHSTLDWIPDKILDGTPRPNDSFSQVTPFSVNGRKSFHYITYVAALATKVISISANRNRVEIGSVAQGDPIWDMERPAATARTIAYTIDEKKYWG